MSSRKGQQTSTTRSSSRRTNPAAANTQNNSVNTVPNSPTVEGKLQVTKSGMGFVLNTDPEQGDVMIRPRDFNTAISGDTVVAAVTKESKVTGKKEGQIVKVTNRKQSEFVGTIELSKNFAFFLADGDKNIPDIYIPSEKINGAKNGDKVIAKLLRWNNKDKKPLGEVVSILNPEDVNDAAMKNLMLENGFEIDFPKEVLEETAQLSEVLDPAEIKKRKDYRNVLTFTIDPNDSKDFDDAISIKRTRGKGMFEVGVHIADVSHYVIPGSALDNDAYSRSTSVYLPDRVNPMLPEKISNELCSLRPNEDKFTFSAIFTISTKGIIKGTWIGRTAIHSDRRFTYNEVQTILDGKEDPLAEDLKIVNEISLALREKRFEKGAINFDSQEVHFNLDAKGKPVGVEVNESNQAHHLIEELMLLANRAVAELAAKTKNGDDPIPFPYRIHDQPDKEKLLPFVAFARKFGYTFDIKNEETIASSFNKMLEQCKGKPESMMLQQLGIRTMAKAAYSPTNIGHYGLGFVDYCHFTSPIRRYPDVMVHRLIQEILDGNKPVDEEMKAKCQHCSEKERASLDCERSANKYKQVEYMQQFVGEEFDGLVSGVSGFGFWVETLNTKCEGLVSIKDLAAIDDFKLMEEDYSLLGMRTGIKFRMGDKVKIQVAAANLEKRQLDYAWVPAKEMQAKLEAEKQQKRKELIESFDMTNQPKMEDIPVIPVVLADKKEEQLVETSKEESIAPKVPQSQNSRNRNNKAHQNNKPISSEATPIVDQKQNVTTEEKTVAKNIPAVAKTTEQPVLQPSTKQPQTNQNDGGRQNRPERTERNNSNQQQRNNNQPRTERPIALQNHINQNNQNAVSTDVIRKTMEDVIKKEISVLSTSIVSSIVSEILLSDNLIDRVAERVLEKKAAKKATKKSDKKKNKKKDK